MNTRIPLLLRSCSDPPNSAAELHGAQPDLSPALSAAREGPDSASDEYILSAWQAQMAELDRRPDLKARLRQRNGELLPDFAMYYKQLAALPRRVRRRLQRQWKRSLAGLALLLALGTAPALAATINVGGSCTLVRAIRAANTDTAVGGCAAGNGADTIVLPAGSTHALSAVNNSTPYGPTGLPVIRSKITINGNSSTIRRNSGAPNFRIFAIAPGGDLTLHRTTVSGGRASSGANPDSRARLGGGILNDNGTLTLRNSTISGNSAFAGGGLQIGGRRFFDYSSVANITDSTISGNTAAAVGGGISGAVYAGVRMTDCTISNNTAQNGGGLFMDRYGTFRLTNCTLSGNTADVSGGGAYVYRLGDLGLNHTTVSGNLAGEDGGGIRLYEGGDLGLVRTLVSGNTAPSGAEVQVDTGYQRLYLDNFNLFGHSGLTNAAAFVGFTPGATDITATSDGTTPTALGAILHTTLANNGGPTKTHALVAGSPAIDVVNDGTCPPPDTDQRGASRPQDGNGDGGAACDVGSFERAALSVTCNGLTATIVGTDAAETISGTPGADVIQALGGNDIIRGFGGNDLICASFGNDQVYGGTSNDHLIGGLGNDRLFGESGADHMNGGGGFDRCNGGSGAGDSAVRCEVKTNVP